MPPQKSYHDEVVHFLKGIPDLTPREYSDKIRSHGYIAQERAVRAVSLMAFRHLDRLKAIFLRDINPDELPAKSNILFVGPTGCGKTFLVETLFREILGLPTVTVDMTSFSETGYVGQDVSTILTRLLFAAGYNPVHAAMGIVCMDEFDKIASGQNNAVFAGAGTTKDVSGLGVQRELLKILEAAEITIPLELSHSDYSPRALLSTRDIGFIACGAFSGLKGLITRQDKLHIGFGREECSPEDMRIAVTYTIEDVELTKHFLDYGFLPELIGRFTRIIPFHALSRDELKTILETKVLSRYEAEFRYKNIRLTVDPAVLDLVVDESVKKETGARGIESAIARHLEDAAFEAYSTPGTRNLNVRLENNSVVFAID